MKHAFLLSTLLFCFLTQQSFAQDFCVTKIGLEINNLENTNKSDKPVLLHLDTETPISLGEMLASGNDIRFYDNCEDAQPLRHWIESDLNTDSTKIWVRMPNLPSNGSDSIYLCYGKTDAPSISDFDATFSDRKIVSGDLTIAIFDTLWEYDYIHIQEGATATLIENHPGLTLRAPFIKIDGTLSADARGYAAGDVTLNGAGPGGGNLAGGAGGAGGGYGGKGGDGSNGAIGGNTYGTDNGFDIERGSGGSGAGFIVTAVVTLGGGPGGAGGGRIKVDSYDFNLSETGTLTSNGDPGTGLDDVLGLYVNLFGAGGGAGGGLLIKSRTNTIKGIVSAQGGNGGMGAPNYWPGGGGAGGRIKLFYESALDTVGSTITSAGGPAGTAVAGGTAFDGEDGTLHAEEVSSTPSVSITPFTRNLCGTCDIVITENNLQTFMCAQDSLKVGVSADKGIAPYTYSWTESNNQTDSVFISPIESKWVYVDVTEDGGNGCTQRDSIFITVNQNPKTEIAQDQFINACENNQLLLSPNNFGGSGNYTAHLWSGDTDYLSSTFLPNVSFNAQDTGSYFLKYQVWDSNSCTAEDSINISVLQGPRVSPRASVTVCQFDDLKLYGNPSSGSGSYVAHLWQGDNEQLNGDTISEAPIFFATVPGVYSLNYTVTDFLGCTASANITVNVDEAPVVNMPDTIEACRTSDLEIQSSISNGSGVYTNYTWFNPEGKVETLNQNSNLFNTSEAGIFDLNLMVEDSKTCIGEKDVKIIIHQLPEIELEQYIETCSGTDVRLEPNISNTPIENATYLWEGETDLLNGSSFFKPIFRHNQAGEYTYTFKVTDDNGCKNSANTIVVNYENPSADFSFNNQLENFSFNANQGNLTSYSWDFGDGTSVTSITRDTTHSYQEKGTYDVCLDVIDVNTCMAQLCKPVEVKNITSIGEIQNNTQVSVFPNPFTNYIEIQGLEKETEYQLISEDGKVISSGMTSGRINLQSINIGKYILEIKTKQKQTFAVIKN